MQPCIPDDWNEYTVTRKFRGTTYVVHVKRTGEKGITVDGIAVESNTIPLSGKETVLVEVTL